MSTPDAFVVHSPCIRECVIDQDNGYCRGCWRTLDEISFWESFALEQKRQIMQRLQERREAAV